MTDTPGEKVFHEYHAELIANILKGALEIGGGVLVAYHATTLEASMKALSACKFPAVAAHRIAGEHVKLPKLLNKFGWLDLSIKAETFLKNLRNRKDEEKKEENTGTRDPRSGVYI